MTSEELLRKMPLITPYDTDMDADGTLFIHGEKVCNVIELLAKLESETSWAKHYSQYAERLEDEIERMKVPMPCGHPGRYAYTADKEPNDGSTWNCLVCLMERGEK